MIDFVPTKWVVAIRDMSAGNEAVGEMWQETKVFDANDPISKILDWAMNPGEQFSRKRITITVPHRDIKDFGSK